MRPRTAQQKQFAGWAAQLPPLGEKQLEWAKRLFPAEAAYFSRRGNNCEFHCQCCGHVEKTLGKWLLTDYGLDNWTCPECGADCKVLPQYGRRSAYAGNVTSSRYVTLVQVFKGVNVFRTFDVLRINSVDANGRGIPTKYTAHEIYQNWILEDGKEIITHRPYQRGFNHFSWDYAGDWGVGEHNHRATGYFEYDDVFTVDGNWFFPGSRITPLLRRNGFRPAWLRSASVDAAKLARRLLSDTRYEELVKTGQEKLAFYFLIDRRGPLDDFMPSVRICVRNGYKITDPSTWCDYIDNLRELELDLRNPHYVCPENLVDAHRAALRRLNKLLEKKRLEDRKKQIGAQEGPYRKRISPFMGFQASGYGVKIFVLGTVEAVFNEGEALHHCIYHNEYFKRKGSLLLSAIDAASGDRLESIEFSLTSGRVLQSRGLQNQNSKKHGQILRLMEESSQKILALRGSAGSAAGLAA